MYLLKRNENMLYFYFSLFLTFAEAQDYVSGKLV